jgi:ABC-type glycerol-3-phosphate transport system substrate-binding protein
LENHKFYTDFANPGKEVFSWNDKLDNSLDLFADGKLAMLFAYSYQLPVIKSKNQKLNFSITKLPQIEGNEADVNFANYWLEVVSSKTENRDVAWNFVQFITEVEQAQIYLEKTKKPTALRALVDKQVDDLDIGIFAEQVLTAKSWYKGNNALAAEDYIGEIIESVSSGQGEISDILGFASKKVQQTITE